MAHATTAHKHFCYVQAAADLPMACTRRPELLGEKQKITVYAIWPSGCTLVGEVNTSDKLARRAGKRRGHTMERTIIALSREYRTGASARPPGGRDAGAPFYDKELITLAAKESGLSEEAVAASEKRRTGSLLYGLYTMGPTCP